MRPEMSALSLRLYEIKILLTLGSPSNWTAVSLENNRHTKFATQYCMVYF